jgi:HEAT repeat protein
MCRIGRQLDMGQRAEALADPSPPVRAMAVTMLADAPDPAATGELLHALHDPDRAVRGAAAEALASRSTVEPEVLALLGSGTPEQQDIAVAALAGHGEAVRDPVIAWAERAVARARLLADARTVMAADRPGTDNRSTELEAFLLTTLDRRVEREHDRVLTAIALLGAPAAGGVIRRSLRSADVDARAQSLEALESTGDPRLAVALTRLLEPAPDVATLDAASSETGAGLDHLCDDGDPWIRGLARLIRASGDDMADPERSLGDIEKMLRLRQIPLFEPLAPEDLQRIARSAEERYFASGEELVREGETGDELFLILDGRVVVTRREPDGTDRRIRTYQTGDHIGELAVLRARPRVATVAADGGPVSTLVIAGEGLTAILRERPEAAMAMLGTLAERISVQ